MFPVYKLERLPAGQRRRKIIALLTGLEKTLYGESESGAVALLDPGIEVYLRSLVRLALNDPKLEANSIPELQRLLSAESGTVETLRLCNFTRHALLTAGGTSPAEWDLLLPEDGAHAAGGERSFFPGVMVYAEDIRSPFNLGSIFRTAEAFGAEKVLVSPLCVPPDHPRAQRSSMGCIDYLSWEQMSLYAIPFDMPVFALETGGTPLEEFEFPSRGIVIIGSEELGISPEGLSRASYGRVSIPMTGIKTSLNVGVAFGILMQAWTSYLTCSASKPF